MHSALLCNWLDPQAVHCCILMLTNAGEWTVILRMLYRITNLRRKQSLKYAVNGCVVIVLGLCRLGCWLSRIANGFTQSGQTTLCPAFLPGLNTSSLDSTRGWLQKNETAGHSRPLL